MDGKLLLLCLPLSLLLATGPVAAAEAKVVSVDYVIGMIEAGLGQDEIVEHILANKLTFRVSEESLGRLREAGAGDELVEVVRKRTVPDRQEWERPRRLGGYGDIWSDTDEGAYYDLRYGYYPGFYGYAFYDPYGFYDPFYRPYPYYSFYFHRYYGPRLHHRFQGNVGHLRGDRVAPRGSPPAGRSSGGGRPRAAPRGSH